MTTLSLEPPRRRSGGRILAIEADAQRARALRHLFRRREAIDLTIVRSVGEATASNARCRPDLRVPAAGGRGGADAALEDDARRRARAGAHRAGARWSRARAQRPESTSASTARPASADAGHDLRRRGRPQPHRQLPRSGAAGGVRRIRERRDRPRGRAAQIPYPLVHTSTPQGADSLSDIIRRVDQIAGPKGRDRRRSGSGVRERSCRGSGPRRRRRGSISRSSTFRTAACSSKPPPSFRSAPRSSCASSATRRTWPCSRGSRGPKSRRSTGAA